MCMHVRRHGSVCITQGSTCIGHKKKVGTLTAALCLWKPAVGAWGEVEGGPRAAEGGGAGGGGPRACGGGHAVTRCAGSAAAATRAGMHASGPDSVQLAALLHSKIIVAGSRSPQERMRRG